VIFCWPTSSMTTQSMLRLCSCVLARMPICSSDESGDASGDKRRVIPFFRKRLRQSTGLLNAARGRVRAWAAISLNISGRAARSSASASSVAPGPCPANDGSTAKRPRRTAGTAVAGQESSERSASMSHTRSKMTLERCAQAALTACQSCQRGSRFLYSLSSVSSRS